MKPCITAPGSRFQRIAFFTYAHFIDAHDHGEITEFRKRLEGEMRAVTGEPFTILQDSDAIDWGEQWRLRISRGLVCSTFLVLLITPELLKSVECRGEIEEFMAHEKALGRNDLILPIVYVDTPDLNDPGRRKTDRLVAELARREHRNWMDLRFEPWTHEKRKRLHGLACQMRNTLVKIEAQGSTPAWPTIAGKKFMPLRKHGRRVPRVRQ